MFWLSVTRLTNNDSESILAFVMIRQSRNANAMNHVFIASQRWNNGVLNTLNSAIRSICRDQLMSDIYVQRPVSNIQTQGKKINWLSRPTTRVACKWRHYTAMIHGHSHLVLGKKKNIGWSEMSVAEGTRSAVRPTTMAACVTSMQASYKTNRRRTPHRESVNHCINSNYPD